LVYKVQSLGRNALLKVKNGGVLELRKGTSIKRMGIIGVFTGSVPDGEVNFETNALTFEGVFNSAIM
jgi:hypothetical protein